MNKILWIMTQNKENAEYLQSRFASELLKKQEIIGYGSIDSSNYDEFFNDENSFWLLINKDFDFIKLLKDFSTKGHVSLLARINENFYCFDMDGNRYDDSWKISEAKQFIESNWNFESICHSFKNYEDKIDQIFISNIAKKPVVEKEENVDVNLDLKLEDIEFIKNITKPESSMDFVSMIKKSEPVVETKLEENKVEISEHSNPNCQCKDCKCDPCECSNEVEVVQESKCGRPDCKCEQEKASKSDDSLCEKCFSSNCSCEQEIAICSECNINPCMCDKKESFFGTSQCSQDNCSSCTGCDWDWSEEDDKYFDENFSHHFSCPCEDKNDCKCESNKEFMNEFVVETISNKNDDELIEQEFKPETEFVIVEDNVKKEEPNETVFFDEDMYSALERIDNDFKKISNIQDDLNNDFISISDKYSDDSSVHLNNEATKTNEEVIFWNENESFELVTEAKINDFELEDSDVKDAKVLEEKELVEFITEYEPKNTSNDDLVSISANTFETTNVTNLEPVVSNDVKEDVFKFDYEKEKTTIVDSPIVTIDFQDSFDEKNLNEFSTNDFVNNSDYVNFDEYVELTQENNIEKPNIEFVDNFSVDNNDEITSFDDLTNNVENIEEEIVYVENCVENNEPALYEEAKPIINTSREKLESDKNISKNLKRFLIELQKEKERLRRKKEELEKRNKKARILLASNNQVNMS